jgi:hypothetical protein
MEWVPYQNAGAMARAALYRLFQLCLVLALLLSLEHRAYAYVDPGSGLATLQAVGATLFGVFYFLRGRIKKMFQSKK